MDLCIEPGTLLASTPDMLDPNFMHCVVLMIQHGSQGAYGLVVNKLSPLTLAHLFPTRPALALPSFPVHWGGPVGLDTLQILHCVPERVPGGLELGEGVHIGGDLEALARLLAEDLEEAKKRVRFVIGYSGWGEGQLEMELERHSWLPAALSAEVVFGADQQRTWRQVVRSVGGEARAYEDLPPDLRWN